MIPGDVRLCLRCQSKGANACPPIPTGPNQGLRIIFEKRYADKHLVSAHLADTGFEGPVSDTDRSSDLAPSTYPAKSMSVRIDLYQCYVFLRLLVANMLRQLSCYRMLYVVLAVSPTLPCLN